MKVETPISEPENIKFTNDNSKITYKQDQKFKKKTLKNNLIPKLYEINVYVCKEWKRPYQSMENGKLFY